MLRAHEWLGVLGALALVVGLYALLVHPAIAAFFNVPRLRTACAAASVDLDIARQKVQITAHRLEAFRRELEQIGGSPPAAGRKDLQIARITALAEQSGVQLNHYLPVLTLDAAEHRAVIVEFAGQGSFTDIHRLFREIESQIDFVDITHFSIDAVRSDLGSRCNVNWTCRINTLKPPQKAATEGAAGSPVPPSPAGNGGDP